MIDNTTDKVEVKSDNFDALVANEGNMTLNDNVGELQAVHKEDKLLKNDVLKVSFNAKSEETYKNLQVPSVKGNKLKENVSLIHEKGSALHDNLDKHDDIINGL